MVRLSDQGLKNGASRLALAVGLALTVPAVLPMQPAVAQVTQIQMGTSFDCARAGTAQSVPSLVCQTPELQFADLHQLQAYYTLRHAQPERQQELRNQFTARIQALVRECSTEQVRASGSQAACVTQALGNLRNFWLEQLQRTGNAAALEEARLPSGNLVGAQQALKTSGFLAANAVVDGVYGSGTREAIARFQTERGIASNGFLTQPTLVALRRASIAGTGPAGAPAAASSSGAPAMQQPAAGSSQQAAQAQPAPRTQTNPPSNTQQTSPRSAASPAPTDAPLQQQLATAARAIEARDYATALRIYRPLAERSVPAAQGGMARLLLNGWGVTRDSAEALRWARLGSTNNDPASLTVLGFLYVNGNGGLPRDVAQGRRYLERAAEQNFPSALRTLATIDTHRSMNASECQRTNELLRRAADLNDGPALRLIALRYSYTRREDCAIQDDATNTNLISFMRRAADAGNAQSQLDMGRALVFNEVLQGRARLSQDRVRGIEYLRLSAEQNFEGARTALQTAQVAPSYFAREPTLLEQIMNYSTSGNTRGNLENFWVSAHNGGHACALTPLGTIPQMNLDQNNQRLVEIGSIDIRSINQTTLRFRARSGTPNSIDIFDDQNLRLFCGNCEMDRLRNAWGLAFRECPGRRSAF